MPPGLRSCGLMGFLFCLKLLQKVFHNFLHIFKQKCYFTRVLATSDVIFWPFRTPEFIVKCKENRTEDPFRLVKYSVFSKLVKKHAFGSDIVRKCDLAKTLVKLQFCLKIVFLDASGGAPERFPESRNTTLCVECYCILINIIVGNPKTPHPLFGLTVAWFY